MWFQLYAYVYQPDGEIDGTEVTGQTLWIPDDDVNELELLMACEGSGWLRRDTEVFIEDINAEAIVVKELHSKRPLFELHEVKGD